MEEHTRRAEGALAVLGTPAYRLDFDVKLKWQCGVQWVFGDLASASRHVRSLWCNHMMQHQQSTSFLAKVCIAAPLFGAMRVCKCEHSVNEEHMLAAGHHTKQAVRRSLFHDHRCLTQGQKRVVVVSNLTSVSSYLCTTWSQNCSAGLQCICLERRVDIGGA